MLSVAFKIAQKDGELLVLKVNFSTAERQCQLLNDQLTSHDDEVKKLKTELNDAELQEQFVQLKVSQLQQEKCTLEQKLKTAQKELQVVADVIMDKPNVVTQNGSLAATLLALIKHLKQQAVEIAAKEKEKAEEKFERRYQEDSLRQEQELARQRQVIDKLSQQVEDHLVSRRQLEQQIGVKSAAVEKLQEQIDTAARAIEKLNYQISVLSKENVELRSGVERERAAVKHLRSELTKNESRVMQLQDELETKASTSPDSGHCDWDSFDEASHSASGSLYASVLRRGLAQREPAEKPNSEFLELDDSDQDLLDTSYWIDNSSKLSLQLHHCSLYYARQERQQALELEQLQEQKQKSRPSSGRSVNQPTSTEDAGS
jgi:hypothetical protein